MPIKLNLAGNRQCPTETVQTTKIHKKFELSIKIYVFLYTCDERRAGVGNGGQGSNSEKNIS
jgi:hypothetical protein